MVLRYSIVILAFVLPLLANAQERDSVRSISEVTVYGRHSEEIVPSQRLSGQRLEALRSFSVADALRYFSGVQIKDYGGVGGLKTVDVRSMGTNHMGVFYDGIKLGNAQNGLVDLGRFSMENIEEIALYNGQKAQIFQPARDFGTSGSIYIRTRRPRFEEGERFHVRYTVKGGSFDLFNQNIVWEQRFSKRVMGSFSAEYTGASGRYKFRYRRVLPSGKVAWDTTAVRQNGDITAMRFEAALFGNTKDGAWNVKAYYYDSDRGIPGAIVNNVWKFSQRQADRNFFVQGQWTKHVSKRYRFQVSGKYAYDWMNYINPDTTLMYQNNRFSQHELYLSTAHNVQLTNNWEANVSVDYQYNTLDANLVNFVYPRRHTLLVAFATQYQLWRFKAMASVLGTNVWDKASPHSPFRLPSEGTETPSREGVSSSMSSISKWTPAVYLSYTPLKDNDDLSFRAFYKKIFRLPTFNDLYYTEIGNINLQPENTQQFDLGFLYSHDWSRGLFRHLELKADGYYNIVDNKIIAVPKGSGQYRWMMMNIGVVHIAGIDATAQTVMSWHRDWALTLCANYTYQKAQDRTDPTDNDPYYGTYGGQIAYIPWHSGSVTGNLVWKGFGLNYAFVYVGERYHTSSNIRENYEQPWYTHDISVSYKWQPFLSHPKKGRATNYHRFHSPFGGSRRGLALTLALECNNIFDQQYDVVLNYPMPGRNWKGILRIEI